MARPPLSAFPRDRRGGVAMMFAIGLPALALIVAGGIDLSHVHGTKQKLQDAADAAALSAAMQLGMIDESGLTPRAQQYVAGQVPAGNGLTYTVTATPVQDEPAVTVTIQAHRDSFFANLLPPGGWHMRVQATASQEGLVPLCVLSTSESDMTELKDSSQMTAPGCLVHSNGDVKVSSSGWLKAHTVQAAGQAAGRITPEPQTGAPPIEDPFASIALGAPGQCDAFSAVGGLLGNATQLLGTRKVPPGTHCGLILVPSGLTIELLPGDHHFKQGQLILGQGAELKGTDVVLIFDKNSNFAFKETSNISLQGRKSGPYAGFVIATTQQNHRVFEISTSSARELLGTVYIPSAQLKVSGANTTVNDQADWTVIVAHDISMVGSAKLVVNSDYAGSAVPVPKGVGPSAGARLER
jgi:Flp pilus assembly protein TadG